MTEYMHFEGVHEKTGSVERSSSHNGADALHQYNSSFCWQNISVWGSQKKAQGLWRRTTYRDFQIVQKASGFVPRGSLIAIMGPSGSGKTTLLAAISRRLREKVKGDVYVNGRTVSVDEMLRLSSFVPQDDLTVQGLTVYEHFKIMAALKMDRNTSEFHRNKKISTLMQEFGIANLSSSYLSDLSGGESRRISIAVQLLTDPLLLFCDEPTTGLDSAYAAVVIRMLKKFSSDGKIVICSIHQPAALIYELFDYVQLLASGGRIVYFGPVMQASDYFRNSSKPSEAKKIVDNLLKDLLPVVDNTDATYLRPFLFSFLALDLICPPNYNIAEFLLNNISFSDFDADKRIANLCQQYSLSSIKHDLEEQIEFACFSDEHTQRSRLKKNRKDHRMNSLAKYFDTKKPSLSTQILALVRRSSLNLRQDYAGISAYLINLLFISTMITTLFGGVTLCSENSVQNIRGALSCMTTFIFYESAYYQFNTLLSERQFVMREINDGLYRIEAYCIAKLLGKLAVAVCETMLLVLIFMSVSKAYSHLSLWSLFLPFMLNMISATAYGCMLSSAFDDLNILFCVATGYEMMSYLLTGITVNLNSLPVILSWLRYLALLYYSIEYILVLEWRRALSLHIRCTASDTNGPWAALRTLADNGYDVRNYQKNILILILISVIFYIITYLFLRRKSKQRVAY